jgi:K+-sensing histidine kinase KdpD
VTRHLLLTTAIALGTVAASLAAGPYRKGALIGAVSSGVTAVASLLFMQKGARSRKPLQAALAVMAVMFLTRILVVALGTAAVVRAGENVFAFIVAFFVPYFTFAAIEIAYLTGLSRGTGPTA